MLADSPARSRHLAGAPPWVHLSLLLPVALALVTLGLLAAVLLGAQAMTPARPTQPSADPPNVVWPHRAVHARVAVPAQLGDPVGGPGGDPGPSPAPEDDIGGVIAGALPAALMILVAAALAAAVALAIGTRHARPPRARPGPTAAVGHRG